MNILDHATQLHREGKLAEAEEAYRAAVLAFPEDGESWRRLGVFAHENGQGESAVQWLEQAIALAPGRAGYFNDLGLAHKGLGNEKAAVASFQRALELEPGFAECMLNLATLWSAGGESNQAWGLFKKALELKPEDPESLLQYGLALLNCMYFDEAAAVFERAVKAAPRSIEAAFYLGAALESANRFEDASVAFAQASQLGPEVGEIWSRWGRLLVKQGAAALAVGVLKTALRCDPKNALDRFYLGYALQRCGHPAEALPHFQAALKVRPRDAEIHNHEGLALKDLGRLVDAAKSFHRAIELAPAMTSALNNLGAVCNELGLSSEALGCFEVVIERQPQSAGALSNIGKILKDRGRAQEGVGYYRRALELDPGNRTFETNLLLGLQYLAEPSAQEIYLEHVKWGEQIAQRSGQPFSHEARDTDQARRLKVGYVSADFCVHPVAVFLEGLFELQDRAGFELYCYSDVASPDAVTERFVGLADQWRDTAGLDALAVAEMVYADGVDILVDLAGHTAGNRLEVFALKPAPIALSYLGYPSTTGLAAIDYRLVDAIVDPPGMTEGFHSEQLLRLDRCAWCFRAPEPSPEVGALPAAERGYVTFGCFNQMAKLNTPLFERWAQILQRVANSRLKLKARSLIDPVVREELTGFFVARGIAPERLEFSGFAPSVREHLAEYQQVDIALDSYPYHGTTTTCEALWMGVPVISQVGGVHVSRVSASLLDAVGLGELAVTGESQYVEAAVALAGQRERLLQLRGELRGRMVGSPLMDAAGFARAVDGALRSIWQDYCQKTAD